LFFLDLFGSIERNAFTFIETEPPTFPPPNAYFIDKHELNVVKLLNGRKVPRYTLICLDASNECRCAGLLYQRGDCIAMAREYNA
jgi:hypothetical protein